MFAKCRRRRRRRRTDPPWRYHNGTFLAKPLSRSFRSKALWLLSLRAARLRGTPPAGLAHVAPDARSKRDGQAFSVEGPRARLGAACVRKGRAAGVDRRELDVPSK